MKAAWLLALFMAASCGDDDDGKSVSEVCELACGCAATDDQVDPGCQAECVAEGNAASAACRECVGAYDTCEDLMTDPCEQVCSDNTDS